MMHLDLFSGIGGFALAAQWAGFETIGFVEIDKYCQQILKKHWPDVPIVGDIRDVTKETFAYADIHGTKERYNGNPFSENNRAFPEGGNCPNTQNKSADIGSSYRHGRTSTATLKSIDLITGGFPCQPFSVAGKRKGDRDDRYLWPEMLRVIKEYQPTWVLGENVAGIVSMALDTVLSDMENAGYEVQAFVIPACAVNAWHRRDRVWIVAHSRCVRPAECEQQTAGIEQSGQGIVAHSKGTGLERPIAAGDTCPGRLPAELCEAHADTEQQQWNGRPEQAGRRKRKQAETVQDVRGNGGQETGMRSTESPLGRMADGLPLELDGYFDTEPDIPRVATGVKNRVDRLKALGNAIVPQVAYQILKEIAKIESKRTDMIQ